MSDLLLIRHQIISAFQSVPMPDASHILRQPSTLDYQEELQIQQYLDGKRWNEISLVALKRRWASFCYLSAEAYHYYLPAALIHALDHFYTASDFVHTVLFCLKPSAYAIYYEVEDRNFIEQTSLFTSEQFCAVAAFHGLFLRARRVDHLTFMAAFSMRFGWGRYDCPERTRFQEFDHRMRHYDYPTVTDQKISGLVEEIRTAFVDTPYPGDNHLTDSRQGDEAAGYALELCGTDWRTIHPELLASAALLCFFTPEGLRYFLPACLIESLIQGEPYSHDLTFGLGEPLFDPPHTPEINKTDWRAYGVQRMACFTRPERVAIIHYLEYCAEQDEYHAAEIRAALEHYWRLSLEQSANE